MAFCVMLLWKDSFSFAKQLASSFSLLNWFLLSTLFLNPKQWQIQKTDLFTCFKNPSSLIFPAWLGQGNGVSALGNLCTELAFE